MDLSWNAVPGATGYRISRSLTSGGSYIAIANEVSSPSYSDTADLTPGTRYFYVVAALSLETVSEVSGEASAVPSDPIVTEDVALEAMNFGFSPQGSEQVSTSIANSGLGQFYQVMASPDLAGEESWSPASSVYLGNGGLLELAFDFDYSANGRYFFRLEAWTE